MSKKITIKADKKYTANVSAKISGEIIAAANLLATYGFETSKANIFSNEYDYIASTLTSVTSVQYIPERALNKMENAIKAKIRKNIVINKNVNDAYEYFTTIFPV